MKTFNRTPTSVYVPTESKVEHSYFNYTQWKGKCTDKNYIGVDQETFEDCKNVYVDGDGVLCSRPMVRIATEVGFQNVFDMWKFGDWTVYKVLKAEVGFTGYQLYFQHDGTLSNPVTVPDKFKLVLADEKIFMFGETQLKYFDLKNSTWNDAKIYKPIISTTVLGVESPLEAKNELTDSYRKQYIWSRKDQTDLRNLYGKPVEVVIGDEIFTIESFEKNQQLTFAKPTFTFTNDSLLGGKPMIDISTSGEVLIAKKVTKTVDTKTFNVYDFSYSVDGVSFNELPAMPLGNEEYNCLGFPRLSYNKTEIIVLTTLGPYAISVQSDGEVTRFPAWTNLYDVYTDIATADKPSINAEYVYSSVYMHDYQTFGFIYGNGAEYRMFVYDYNSTPKYYSRLFETATPAINYNEYLPFVIQPSVINSQSHPSVIYCYTTGSSHFRELWARQLVQKDVGSTDIQVGKSFSATPSGYLYIDSISKLLSQCSLFLENGRLYCVILDTHNVVKCGYINVATTSYIEENTYVASSSTYLDYITAQSTTFIATSKIVYYNYEPITVDNILPLASARYLYYWEKGTSGNPHQAYSTDFPDQIKLIETVNATTQKNYLFDCEAELQDYFISFGKRLLINAPTPNAEDFEWYFPTYKTQSFDYEITGLHPISTTELAVFQEDSIYYAVPTTITYNSVERSAYAYYKSRLPLGCAKGCDIVTSFDGKYTIFSTVRGLVAMAYQDFVSSSEQALNFLSDPILEDYTAWASGAVKITPHKYWLIIYRQDDYKSYVYDMRNGSWWDMEYTKNVHKVLPVGQKVYVVIESNKLHCLKVSDNDYHDEHAMIDWYLVSQKLHFNAVNYYKHIVNLTLSAISSATKEFTCKLNVNIFRKAYNENVRPDLGIAYKVEMVRVYVRRINYMKLNEFQFILRSDNEAVQQLPLSLTNISIKHKVTGQVR